MLCKEQRWHKYLVYKYKYKYIKYYISGKECDLFRFPPAAAAANDSSNVSYVPITGVDDKKPNN